MKYILLGLVLFFCFKINVWLGVGAVFVGIGFVVYKMMPNLYAQQAKKPLDERDYETAIGWFQKAYDTNRASVDLKNGYGMLLMRLGRFDEAEVVFNEIVLDRRVPENKKTPSKQYRILSYLHQGKTEDAIEDAYELFETYRNTIMYGLLGYIKLTYEDDLEGALAFCREAYDYNADDRDIIDNLVVALYRTGALDEAEAYAKRLRTDCPDFLEACYHSTLIAKAMGNLELAKECAVAMDNCVRTGLTTVSEDEKRALKIELGLI